MIERSHAAELGRETVRILEAGRYETAAGVVVEIREAVEAARAGTRAYPPDEPLPELPPGERVARFEVVNESTLDAAARLVARGLRPVALNFASAQSPGGGFLGGARAQEESLARSSGLYACLVDQPMYAFHRRRSDPLYTNYALYSPDVPVFRRDDGTLLEHPFLCSFLTAPAVNAKAVYARRSATPAAVRAATRERIHKVLTLAALHEHEAIVLGAWGCGAFGNDSEEIAELFHDALTGPCRGWFTDVVFAILDWSEERRFIGPFERRFASA
jgi:uncharacterized protein (TIGR02452 family)